MAKNSWIASHTKRPIDLHATLKSPLLYPSGPGAFQFEIEDIASLISSSMNRAQSLSYCSTESKVPD